MSGFGVFTRWGMRPYTQCDIKSHPFCFYAWKCDAFVMRPCLNRYNSTCWDHVTSTHQLSKIISFTHDKHMKKNLSAWCLPSKCAVRLLFWYTAGSHLHANTFLNQLLCWNKPVGVVDCPVVRWASRFAASSLLNYFAESRQYMKYVWFTADHIYLK